MARITKNKRGFRTSIEEAREMLDKCENDEAQVLAAWLEAKDFCAGFTNPVEKFIVEILKAYANHPALSADDIRREVEEFENNISHMQRAIRRHPWLAELPAEDEGDPTAAEPGIIADDKGREEMIMSAVLDIVTKVAKREDEVGMSVRERLATLA